VKRNNGIPWAFHLYGRLADRALERLVRALTVDDPGEHAVLMGLECARARVDPGGRRIRRVLISEADEASSRGAGRLGRDRQWHRRERLLCRIGDGVLHGAQMAAGREASQREKDKKE
jgi:hypothetical protein